MKHTLVKVLMTGVFSVVAAIVAVYLGGKFTGTTLFVGYLAVCIFLLNGHYASKIEEISMDLDAVEQRLEEVDPDYAYTKGRFRYPEPQSSYFSAYWQIVVLAGFVGYFLSTS